jgi:hypothetical protein
LIGVLDAIIQSGEGVEGHLGQVLVVDVLGEASTVLEGKFALMVAEHGIGECGRNGNNHPPYQATNEVLALASDESRNKSSIQFGDIQRDERSQDEEHAVADEKAQLLALPTGYTDSQQADEVAKELSVQLDLLPATSCASFSFSMSTGCSSLLLGGFLLVDGVAYAVQQGDEETDVDGA